MRELLGEEFLRSFLSNLIATLIGAFLGVWGAFRLEYRRKQEDLEAILEHYDRAVRDNVDILTRISKNVDPEEPHLPHLKVGPIQALSAKAVGSIKDITLLENLQHFTYELEHLNWHLDLHYQLAFGPIRAAFVLDRIAKHKPPWADSYEPLKRFFEQLARLNSKEAGDLVEKGEEIRKQIRKQIRGKGKQLSAM